MVLNQPDAKLLLELVRGWSGYSEFEPQLGKLMGRLQLIADGSEYNINELDATTWKDETNKRELLFMYEDEQHLLIELCTGDKSGEEGEHHCDLLITIRLNMVTGELG